MAPQRPPRRGNDSGRAPSGKSGRPPARRETAPQGKPGRPPARRETAPARKPVAKRTGPSPSAASPRRQPVEPGADRLQKILAHAGVGSRRACEDLILQGRVSVGGQVVRELGTKVDPAKTAVAVDGQKVQHERLVYFAVYKPKGYVSTNNDPSGRPRVLDILPEIPQRVYTVGRLDEMSVGLMLLTNDGELANKLAHPKFGVEKLYRVIVAGSPTHDVLKQLTDGIWLAEGKVRAKSVRAVAKKGEATILELVLAEGKNREVRRMLAKLGHKVMSLTRVAVGPITVRGLTAGQYRPLTGREVDLLRGSPRASRCRCPGCRIAGPGPPSSRIGPAGPKAPGPATIARPLGSATTASRAPRKASPANPARIALPAEPTAPALTRPGRPSGPTTTALAATTARPAAPACSRPAPTARREVRAATRAGRTGHPVVRVDIRVATKVRREVRAATRAATTARPAVPAAIRVARTALLAAPLGIRVARTGRLAVPVGIKADRTARRVAPVVIRAGRMARPAVRAVTRAVTTARPEVREVTRATATVHPGPRDRSRVATMARPGVRARSRARPVRAVPRDAPTSTEAATMARPDDRARTRASAAGRPAAPISTGAATTGPLIARTPFRADPPARLGATTAPGRVDRPATDHRAIGPGAMTAARADRVAGARTRGATTAARALARRCPTGGRRAPATNRPSAR